MQINGTSFFLGCVAGVVFVFFLVICIVWIVMRMARRSIADFTKGAKDAADGFSDTVIKLALVLNDDADTRRPGVLKTRVLKLIDASRVEVLRLFAAPKPQKIK